MLQTRTFTLDEANRLLPQVDKGLQAATQVLNALRDVRDQLTDLRIIWGVKVEAQTCPDHEEYVGFRDRFAELERDLAQKLDVVRGLGCEVKDPDIGLVDFSADRNGEIVLLCWKRGEDRIRFWHSLTEGYGGRRPMASF